MNVENLKESKIVLIDDSTEWLLVMQAAMKSHGIEDVLTVSEPSEALRIIGEFQPDLVLLDVHMPGVSGHTLLDSFSKKFPMMPTIMVTNETSLEHAISCMQKGAVDFIRKDLKRDDLIERVAICLARMRRAEKNPFARMQRLPSLKEAGNLLVEEALQRTGGNQSEAARMLDVSPQAISKRTKSPSFQKNQVTYR